MATATATANVQAGRYNLVVAQTAEAVQTNLTGFGSETAAVVGADYKFTIGGTTYQPDVADNITTLAGLRNWINAEPTLKDKVQATILQSATGQYVLSLRGLAVGASNALVTEQFTGNPAAWTAVTPYQQAQDAIFTLNGVQFTRSSNTVTDAVSGLTVNLVQTGSTILQASNTDTTQAQEKLSALVTAYNELLALYKEQTAASADMDTRGLFNSDFSISTVMRQLQSGLTRQLTTASGATLADPANASNTSTYIDLLGLELNDDGTLALNSDLLERSTLLPSVLAGGVRIGFDSASGKDLSQSIAAMLTSNGLIYERVQIETQTQRDLQERKVALEEKLVTVEQRYRSQYAALDALLYQLNSTSESLKSALDSLTASQQND